MALSKFIVNSLENQKKRVLYRLLYAGLRKYFPKSPICEKTNQFGNYFGNTLDKKISETV
jgi:hypothetical protein